MKMNVRETIAAIRNAESLFNDNELNESSEWTKNERRFELTQLLLILRADLTDLVETLMAKESNIKAA